MIRRNWLFLVLFAVSFFPSKAPAANIQFNIDENNILHFLTQVSPDEMGSQLQKRFRFVCYLKCPRRLHRSGEWFSPVTSAGMKGTLINGQLLPEIEFRLPEEGYPGEIDHDNNTFKMNWHVPFEDYPWEAGEVTCRVYELEPNVQFPWQDGTWKLAYQKNTKVTPGHRHRIWTEVVETPWEKDTDVDVFKSVFLVGTWSKYGLKLATEKALGKTVCKTMMLRITALIREESLGLAEKLGEVAIAVSFDVEYKRTAKKYNLDCYHGGAMDVKVMYDPITFEPVVVPDRHTYIAGIKVARLKVKISFSGVEKNPKYFDMGYVNEWTVTGDSIPGPAANYCVNGLFDGPTLPTKWWTNGDLCRTWVAKQHDYDGPSTSSGCHAMYPFWPWVGWEVQ